MDVLGFKTDIPEGWNGWWVAMWALTSVTLIALAFFVPFWPRWLIAAVVLFLVPELISLIARHDSLPPLTHTIRHFLPNWVAFSLIYGVLGSIGGRWLDFPRPYRMGILFASLGWLTDHFAVTYAHPDPFPFSKRAKREGTDRLRMPL